MELLDCVSNDMSYKRSEKQGRNGLRLEEAGKLSLKKWYT